MASQSTRAWIDGLSASAVRDAVRAVVPDLAGAPVELHVEFEQIDPIWHRGTAWLGHTHAVKFAWSAKAAHELARERIAMLALGGTRFARWMPTVEATSERPLLIVTRRVEGVPCWGEILSDSDIARDVATALADLHDPRVLSAIRNEGIEPPPPRHRRTPMPSAPTSVDSSAPPTCHWYAGGATGLIVSRPARRPSR